MTSIWTWQQIVEALAQHAIGTTARIEVHRIQHPRDGGLTPTFGLPRGQRASFRAPLSDGSILCVEDFGTVYEAWLDRAAPSIERPTFHPSSDALGAALGLSALGALVGLALGQNQRSVMTGALLGGAVGLGTAGIKEANASPAASKAALGLAQTLARLAVSNAGSKGGRPPAHPAALRTTKRSTSQRRTRKSG